MTKSTENTHQDHIPDEGHVSMLHCNMVHKPILIPKAMTILDAKAVLDKQRTNAETTGLVRVKSAK